MTPACVASASINSAATKTRGIMERIRIGVGTDNYGSKAAGFRRPAQPLPVFHRAARAQRPSSYNRHRRLSISVSGTFALPTGAPSKLSRADLSTQSTATHGAPEDYLTG